MNRQQRNYYKYLSEEIDLEKKQELIKEGEQAIKENGDQK